jgi:hypothetical protein
MSQDKLAMKIGGKYNWKGQPERLMYIGYNFSGNGYWHQFEKVDEPGVVWCEVLDDQLSSFEETVPTEEKPAAFVKEPRYVVLKIKDMKAYLGNELFRKVMDAGEKIAEYRAYDGKPPFNAVVVEQDWPEFDVVWEMIEARVTGNPVAAQEPIGTLRYSSLAGLSISISAPDLAEAGMKLYARPQRCSRCAELDPQRLREFMRAMQAGEMTVSRGIELIDMWLAGNYSDDQLPPVQNTLGEDEWPMQKIADLVAEIERLNTNLKDAGEFVRRKLLEQVEKADRIRALEAEKAKADAVFERLENIAKDVREARYMVLDPLKTYTAEQKVEAEKRTAIAIADRFSTAIAAGGNGGES